MGDATALAVAHFTSMEMRRAWMDHFSRRSQDEQSAVDAWVRKSLSQVYDDVLREELPKELLALLMRD